ncbi:MAG: hypothetical protein RL550_1423, partial [Actinomycetota bacterium]
RTTGGNQMILTDDVVESARTKTCGKWRSFPQALLGRGREEIG